jgi:hypothetical protein
MATKQPKWELIANLGDVHYLDHGGYFVYRDKTGVYPEEAELLVVGDSDEYTIYRFSLERLKMVKGFLVPIGYRPDWPHPVERYDEWFHEKLGDVADSIGTTKQELEKAFTSANPLERAHAYRAIGDYRGFENLDSYPLAHTSREEVARRYSKVGPRRSG